MPMVLQLAVVYLVKYLVELKGFHYSKAMDMVEIGIGYAPKGGKTWLVVVVLLEQVLECICKCAFVKIDPMDGLEIGFGVGETAKLLLTN